MILHSAGSTVYPVHRHNVGLPRAPPGAPAFPLDFLEWIHSDISHVLHHKPNGFRLLFFYAPAANPTALLPLIHRVFENLTLDPCVTAWTLHREEYLPNVGLSLSHGTRHKNSCTHIEFVETELARYNTTNRTSATDVSSTTPRPIQSIREIKRSTNDGAIRISTNLSQKPIILRFMSAAAKHDKHGLEKKSQTTAPECYWKIS